LTRRQRSYIRADVARELEYVSLDKLEIAHLLFGGIKSKGETRNMFKIYIKNLDGSYACNFSTIEQDVICGSISSIKRDKWIDELRTKNINLSDIGNTSGPIDILIGADVAGKLITGKKYDLKNGLTALETYLLLGWTVLGKVNKESKIDRTDTAVTITTMFVQEVSLSDLWRLDVIGITDPIEKVNKEAGDERTREFLIRTTKQNVDRRYEVKLPWMENQVPVSSNYDIARKRLEKCFNKLAAKGLLEAYHNVFKE